MKGDTWDSWHCEVRGTSEENGEDIVSADSLEMILRQLLGSSTHQFRLTLLPEAISETPTRHYRRKLESVTKAG